MTYHQTIFRSINEDHPGEKWLACFSQFAPGYRQWFLKEGEFNRPSYEACKQAIKHYLPKLYPLYKTLLKLTNSTDIDARLLSLYCPTPYVTGCSQAVWTRYTPILVRNYDYDPSLSEGVLLNSCWHGTRVIAMTDCLWGVLDGMNEHGLSVALSFGGNDDVGSGFGIPLILRYILEFCQTTAEAIEILQTVPVHMAYNITILDAQFEYKTVEVSPVHPPIVSNNPIAVNHQGSIELTNYAIFSKSLERKQQLLQKIQDPLISIEAFINAFEYAPLFVSNYQGGFGTLYTAVYNPGLRAMEYRWPHGIRLYQSFDHFDEKEFLVTF